MGGLSFWGGKEDERKLRKLSGSEGGQSDPYSWASLLPTFSEYSLDRPLLKLKLQYIGHYWKELIHWKRHWYWKRLRAGGGEGGNRGWDGWMASPTQWTRVWTNSGRWWSTGKSRLLQFMGLQRIRNSWATEQQLSFGQLTPCSWPLATLPQHMAWVPQHDELRSLFYFFKISHHLSSPCFTACGILVPHPGIEAVPPASGT